MWPPAEAREDGLGAYDFEGLDSVDAIRRILEIATIDVLGLENSVVRAPVLISAVQAATELLETGELEARIASLETATGLGRTSIDLFDDDAAWSMNLAVSARTASTRSRSLEPPWTIPLRVSSRIWTSGPAPNTPARYG